MTPQNTITREELIRILTERFYENFAEQIAAKVCRSSENVGTLFELSTTNQELDTPNREKISFRSAYVLEKIYFDYPSFFAPYTEQFVEKFPQCNNASAKRHYGKMMAHLLQNYTPRPDLAEAIAESAANWVIESKSKIAVKIHAMEVLLRLKKEVQWLQEIWDDLLNAVSKEETPAIRVRIQEWRKAIF